jgi:hypothetical protein
MMLYPEPEAHASSGSAGEVNVYVLPPARFGYRNGKGVTLTVEAAEAFAKELRKAIRKSRKAE